MELTSTEHRPQNATLSSKFIEAKDIMWISYINPQLRMCTHTLMYAYATNSKMSLGDIQIVNTRVVVPGRRGHIHWQWSKRKATHELEPSSPPLLAAQRYSEHPSSTQYKPYTFVHIILPERGTHKEENDRKPDYTMQSHMLVHTDKHQLTPPADRLQTKATLQL